MTSLTLYFGLKWIYCPLFAVAANAATVSSFSMQVAYRLFTCDPMDKTYLTRSSIFALVLAIGCGGVLVPTPSRVSCSTLHAFAARAGCVAYKNTAFRSPASCGFFFFFFFFFWIVLFCIVVFEFVPILNNFDLEDHCKCLASKLSSGLSLAEQAWCH